MGTRLKFLGAVHSVTGSKCLLSYRRKNYLIDCGLFQGLPELRQLNRESLAIPASEIAAVFLTHAHLDHSGYLPKLYKDGFRGPIYCSKGTMQLAAIILRDAAYLEQEQADYATKTAYSRHEKPEPLFSVDDAENVIRLFKPIERREWVQIDDELSLRLFRAGHIIGASLLQLRLLEDDKPVHITFTGDLGNQRSVILKGPEQLPDTDVLILESTYGNRLHEVRSPLELLGEHLATVLKRRGVAIIPAFAVGRSQELIYLISLLEKAGVIPKVPVILDSPMSKKALDIFLQREEDQILESGFGPRREEFFPEKFEATESTDESMLACMRDGPAIIISASGMLSGGRILHHLKARISDPRNMVIFSGYQAEGTKGRFLQDQAAVLGTMRILHQEVEVAASIVTIDSLSSHADYEEMIAWLKQARSLPQTILLNHGERGAQEHLAMLLQRQFRARVHPTCQKDEWTLKELLGPREV